MWLCRTLTLYLCRFGSFEIFKTRDGVTGRVGPSVGRMDILHQLLDYVTSTFYPEVRCVMNMHDIDINFVLVNHSSEG